MPKSETSLVLIFSLCALGCAHAPERVSLDFAELTSKTPTKPVVASGPSGIQPFHDTIEVPAMPQRTVFLGTGERQAKLALEAAKANQKRAYEEALADFRRTFRAEARIAIRERGKELSAKYEALFDKAYSDLRKLFDAHADRVGPLWVKLSGLAGFPDKKRAKSVPPPESDFLARADYFEAEKLRSEIAQSDAEYRKEVDAKLEGLRQKWRAEKTDLEADRIRALDAAEQNAEAEAKRLSEEALKALEQSLIQDTEPLPAVPGARAAVSSPSMAPVPDFTHAAEPWDEGSRLRQMAALFAEVKGYRLVAPGPGVRDATKEFENWQTNLDGPSRN